jgi:hypothetical protein
MDNVDLCENNTVLLEWYFFVHIKRKMVQRKVEILDSSLE